MIKLTHGSPQLLHAFLFFLFDRMDKHKAMRGVILAMLAYGLYIVPSIAIDELTKLGWI